MNIKDQIMTLAALSIAVVIPSVYSSAFSAEAGPVEDPVRVVKIQKGQPIFVGAYMVLSGPDTGLGLDQLRGAEIAIDDANGELLGHPIKLVAEDSLCSAEGGQTAALKLSANRQIVFVVGPACSSAATPGAPILWQAGIPSIGISATSPALTAPNRSENYDGFLRVSYNDKRSAPRIADWVYDVLNIRNVATIHDGSPYAANLVRIFQDSFQAKGGQVCAAEAVAPSDVDMRPMLTRIAICTPDLIYLPLVLAPTGHIARQVKEIKGLENTLMVGSDSSLSQDLIAAAGNAVIGFRFTTTAMEAEDQGEGYPALRESYYAKYGEYPIQGWHQYAYDAMALGLMAVKGVAVTDEKGNTYIPIQRLLDTLKATKNYPGMTGNLSCDELGDCGVYKLAVYEYVNDDPMSFELGKNPRRIYP